MKKNAKGLLMALFLVGILAMSTSILSVSAPASAKEEAIEKGLEWLVATQDATSGAWSLGYYPAGCTGMAIVKLCEHAKRTLHMDPFSDDYIYKDNVVAGMNYLFTRAYTQSIGMQPAGNPDSDGDGIGVYFSSGQTGYEVGIGMMALEACCHPEFVVNVPTSAVHGWTYLEVMRDCVDYVSWAQNEAGGSVYRGGWRYGPNYGSSDNSVSQWPVLGLMSAEAWGLTAPAWVKSELLDYWLTYTQNANGGFGYTGPSGTDIDTTGAGLIMLTYCGLQTTDARWDAARSYIGTYWSVGGQQNVGDGYAMYAVMKASMLAQPDVVWTYGDHDWQEEYDAWILANQNADGHWDGRYSIHMNTCYCLLVLQKVAPPPPAIHLDAEPPVLIDLTDPVGTVWHELYPDYCNRYQLSSWADTDGNGVLDYCDEITLGNMDTGALAEYHVEGVTVTIKFQREPIIIFEPLYLEFEGDINDFPFTEPERTMWHEVYPEYCRWYDLISWEDLDMSGHFSPSDNIEMKPIAPAGPPEWGHVDAVKTDVLVTRKPTPPPGPVGGLHILTLLDMVRALIPWIALALTAAAFIAVSAKTWIRKE